MTRGFAGVRPTVLGTLAWLAAAAPGVSQTLGQAPESDFSWVRWLGALLLCLGLAAGGAFALRARLGVGGRSLPSRGPLSAWLKGAAGPPRRVQVVESVRASPTLELCLFTCDGQDFLVAATPHGLVQLRPAGLNGEAA